MLWICDHLPMWLPPASRADCLEVLCRPRAVIALLAVVAGVWIEPQPRTCKIGRDDVLNN